MMDSQKIKKALLKGAKMMFKPILVIAVVVIVLVSLFWGTIDGIFSKASEIFDDIVDNVKIDGNNIIVDEEYMTEAKERLERLGIDSSTLGLGSEEDYLDRFLEAEIVTNFPYLGGDGLQGAVYFERAKADRTTTELQYLPYDEFYGKVNNGEDVNDYFTVDQEDWTVHVMKIDGNIEKINYKNMVEKFAMPFEFPIALSMTSQNPQFALAVVNLVKDSRITITIAESETTTTITGTEHYHEKVEQITPQEGDEPVQTQLVSEGDREGEPQVTTETTTSTEIFLSSARTWILNYTTNLTYDESSEDLEPVEVALDPETTTETVQRPNGTFIRTTKSERTNVTQTHKEYKRWIKGRAQVIDKAENFTNLIIRTKSVNGQGLLEIAKQCHDYVCERNFSYLQDYTRNTIPISESGNTTIDCSSYVSWVLYEAGYKDLGGYQHSTDDGSFGAYGDSKGWERIQSLEDTQPGDICFWAKNGDPYHVNILVSKDSGRYLFYDCGSTALIRTYEPTEWWAMQDFYYAFRPNDEIASALNPQTQEELKDQIENYIEGVTEGTYSVSVINLDKSSDTININNERVKSNGLVKLFIMATAYSEVRNNRISEESISTDIRNMITSDNNSAANSLLKTLGNGDIAKGVDKVNEYARQNGYTNTKLEGQMDDEKMVDGNDQTYTSVRDVSTILKKIYDRTCVNSTFSEKMMELLQGQIITDMIPSTLVGAQVASKSGEQNGIAQDAAIISTENANYLIVVSASDLSSTEIGKENIRQIANIVNVYYAENGTLNDNENLEDDEIETRMNGDRVCYRLPSGEFQCPLNNLVEAREMLFELLGKNSNTQSHERLMRYLLYLLTGNDYGVTEFDFYEFLGIELMTAGAGDYVVDTTQSPEAIVITDIDTLRQAFSWYSSDQVLQQYAEYFLECQEKYHVNAIFAAAVSITESSAGTNIAIGGNNMFSISNGGAGNWNSYGSMEASIESFFKLISGEYFPNGQYTVSQISDGGNHSYCVPPEPWVTNTTNYMTQMFNAAGIDTSSVTSGSTGPGTDLQQRVANEAINNAYAYPHTPGYCEQWAEAVYRGVGINVPYMGCAGEAGTAWIVSSSMSDIPVGAMVFGWSGRGTTHAGHNAGHVGIYIGNGMVMSNDSTGIETMSVETWGRYSPWRGWGWPGGIDLSK